jgi:acyl carrier protein
VLSFFCTQVEIMMALEEKFEIQLDEEGRSP